MRSIGVCKASQWIAAETTMGRPKASSSSLRPHRTPTTPAGSFLAGLRVRLPPRSRRARAVRVRFDSSQSSTAIVTTMSTAYIRTWPVVSSLMSILPAPQVAPRVRGCRQEGRGRSAHPRSSDGAPAINHVWKSAETAANRHSATMSRAMARSAPIEAFWDPVRHRSRSHTSKTSGSGSASLARASSQRLSDIPIASGVVSRLRRRRRPSEASSAARRARQTSAGRSAVTAEGRVARAASNAPRPH